MKAVKKNKTNNRKMITFQQEDHTLTIEMNREIGTDLSLWVEDDKLITFRAGNREMTEHLDSLTEVTKENDIKIEWYIDRINIYFGSRMKVSIQCDYANNKVEFKNCLQEFVEIKGISIKLIREFIKILDVELPEEA